MRTLKPPALLNGWVSMDSVTLLANGITTMMAANIFHLLIGNTIIALVEWWILVGVLRIKPGGGRAALLGAMVVANYVSAWTGARLLPELGGWLRDLSEPTPPVVSVRWIAPAVVLCAFLLSVVVEGGIAALVRGVRAAGWSRVVRGLLLVHLVSYAGLGVFYVLAGDATVSALTTRVVQPGEIGPPSGTVYYLARSTGELRRVRLDGTGDEAVASEAPIEASSRSDLERASWGDRQLWGEQTETGWVIRTGSDRDGPQTVVLRGEAGCVSEWRRSPADPPGAPYGSEARPCSQQVKPRFRFSTWPSEGVFARRQMDRTARRTMSFGLSTPVANWSASHVSGLPGDLAVFALGPAQVMLWDPERNRAALLARGTCPVVVLDEVPPGVPIGSNNPP